MFILFIITDVVKRQFTEKLKCLNFTPTRVLPLPLHTSESPASLRTDIYYNPNKLLSVRVEKVA